MSTLSAPSLTSANPQTKLLSRITSLATRLTTTTLSLSSLVACNRSLDGIEAVLLPTSPSAEGNESVFTASPRIRRIRRRVTEGVLSNSGLNGKGEEKNAEGKEERGERGVIEDLSARFERVVEGLKMRGEEEKHIRHILLQKSTAAAAQVAHLSKQVKELSSALSFSAAELRYLSSRMDALEGRRPAFPLYNHNRDRDHGSGLQRRKEGLNHSAQPLLREGGGRIGMGGELVEEGRTRRELVEGGGDEDTSEGSDEDEDEVKAGVDEAASERTLDGAGSLGDMGRERAEVERWREGVSRWWEEWEGVRRRMEGRWERRNIQGKGETSVHETSLQDEGKEEGEEGEQESAWAGKVMEL